MATRRSGSIRGRGGLTLHTLSWIPDANPRGMVVLAHGYGEHAGRYGHLALALVEQDIAVHAVDFAAHGRSAGHRGDVNSFEGWVGDLGNFVREMRSQSPELKCGLFAHSFGGSVATALCSRDQDVVDALVLSAPYLAHGEGVSAWRLRLVRLLARSFPNLGLDRVDPNKISRLPAQVEAYRNDPLVFHGKVTARTVTQLFAGFGALNDANRISVPLLILHGSDDRIADPTASGALSRLVSSVDVTFELVADGYHELLNDLGRERVLARVVDWFRPRLTGEQPE